MLSENRVKILTNAYKKLKHVIKHNYLALKFADMKEISTFALCFS